MALTWVHYEIAVIAILTPILFFFAYLLKANFDRKRDTVLGHLTFLLFFLWLKFILEICPGAYQCTSFQGFVFPSINVTLDIIITGYLVAIIWHMWWNERDVSLNFRD